MTPSVRLTSVGCAFLPQSQWEVEGHQSSYFVLPDPLLHNGQMSARFCICRCQKFKGSKHPLYVAFSCESNQAFTLAFECLNVYFLPLLQAQMRARSGSVFVAKEGTLYTSDVMWPGAVPVYAAHWPTCSGENKWLSRQGQK